MNIDKLQKSLSTESPQKAWNPPFCGDIDIRIKQDGTWSYMGTPITRAPLVKLFASVLRHENDRYFLVTPVEKVGIQVDDVPFVVVEWQWQDDRLLLKTQQDEWIEVSAAHPVELRNEPSVPRPHEANTGDVSQVPYVLVRHHLWARLHRNVYYQLLEHAQVTEKTMSNGTVQNVFFLMSNDYPVPLGHVEV